MSKPHYDYDSGVDFVRRRASAEGARRPHTPPSATSAGQQTYGDEEILSECRKMLAQTEGVYHLFGTAVEVMQPHTDKNFIVLKFLGGLPDCPLLRAGVRPGLFVPFSMFMNFWRKPGEMQKESENELGFHQKLFSAFLLGNPVVQDALRLNAKARHDARIANEQAVANNILAGAKPSFVRPKRKPAQLQSIVGLVDTPWGIWKTDDGIELTACRLGFGNKPDTRVIRVTDTPSGHPFEVMKEKKIFIFQSALAYGSDKPSTGEMNEKAKLAKELRTYARKLLADANYTFKQPDEQQKSPHDTPDISSMAGVDQEHHVALGYAEESPLVEGVISMRGVDQEHLAEEA